MKSFFAFAAMAVLFVAQPAFAQGRTEQRTGSMVREKPKAMEPRAAGILRKDFSRCVYNGQRKAADNYLLHTDFTTVDETDIGVRKFLDYFRLAHCLSNNMDEPLLVGRIAPSELRDWLAEEAYVYHNRTVPVLPESPATLVVVPTPGNRNAEQARALSEFGDCVVRRDVAGADALLRTTPASKAEQAAAVNLAAAFGACMPAGQTMKMNAEIIRSMTAYAMWSRFVRQKA